MFAPMRYAQRAALDEQAARVRATGGRPHILKDNPLFDVASALAYLDTTLVFWSGHRASMRSTCRPAARARQAWCWASTVSDEEARKLYPQGWTAPRPYIRIVPQPTG
jgi:hypothetical protein